MSPKMYATCSFSKIFILEVKTVSIASECEMNSKLRTSSVEKSYLVLIKIENDAALESHVIP